MRRAFTLIELLVIVAILATMVTIGVGSISSGQGRARIKGATRDVYAAIRHARSTALVTGQRVLVNYSNTTVDDEVAIRIEVVAAKIMSADGERPNPQPYFVRDYKDLSPAGRPRQEQKTVDTTAGVGESVEEILFSPMDTDVVKGMRILVKKGDEGLKDETSVQTRSRISVFSNVDYLQNRYKEAKKESEERNADGEQETEVKTSGISGSVNDMTESVSVIWETNGAVEPHRIWIYPEGKKPEDGLLLDIDSFGAVNVLEGDGRTDG